MGSCMCRWKRKNNIQLLNKLLKTSRFWLVPTCKPSPGYSGSQNSLTENVGKGRGKVRPRTGHEGPLSFFIWPNKLRKNTSNYFTILSFQVYFNSLNLHCAAIRRFVPYFPHHTTLSSFKTSPKMTLHLNTGISNCKDEFISSWQLQGASNPS
jgi:hypothetical protein